MGRAYTFVGVALAVVSVERLLNATMISSGDDNAAVSLRLVIAFLCGGLAPLFLVLGYLNRNSRS
jgi:hypothetical protein